MLPGILHVSCAPDSVLTSFPAVHSVPERKAPDAACPTIAYTADGSPLLPHIDLNGISPQVIVSILQAFMIAAWSKYSCSFQFRWHWPSNWQTTLSGPWNQRSAFLGQIWMDLETIILWPRVFQLDWRHSIQWKWSWAMYTGCMNILSHLNSCRTGFLSDSPSTKILWTPSQSPAANHLPFHHLLVTLLYSRNPRTCMNQMNRVGALIETI